jgi:hypothetical protein
MKSVRYKKWDGCQAPFELKRKSVVETFLDNIMKGMGPRTSLAQMMWSGFPLSGMNFRVMGLEEMIQEFQKAVTIKGSLNYLPMIFIFANASS